MTSRVLRSLAESSNVEHQRQCPAVWRELVSGRLAGVESVLCCHDASEPGQVKFFLRVPRADLGFPGIEAGGALSVSAKRGPYSTQKHAFPWAVS